MSFRLLKTIGSSLKNWLAMTPSKGTLIYCEKDPEVKKIGENCLIPGISLIPYQAHPHEVKEGITYLLTPQW
jgi:UDP-N-acetylmuramate: L-alanyl-gamma-D-glutamyl-meso-diaminopimelate ligase